MITRSQLQARIQGHPVLAAAISGGDLQVIYRDGPVVSADRLISTWTIELLLLDPEMGPLVVKALESLGFELDGKTATLSSPITPAERAAMEEADAQEAAANLQAAADRKEALLLQTLEAMQEQINELREELEMMRLIRSKPAADGAPGKAGRDGRDGRDIQATEVKLTELADVNAPAPESGLVLTWTGHAWEPQPTQTITHIGGGGGGGSPRAWPEDWVIQQMADTFGPGDGNGSLGNWTEAKAISCRELEHSGHRLFLKKVGTVYADNLSANSYVLIKGLPCT